MKCPQCKETELKPTLSTKGVLVDWCPRCEGIWLDKGEIFYFTGTPASLNSKIEKALKNTKPSSRLNPYTQTSLVELSLSGGALTVDYCPETGGIWIGKGELERMPAAEEVRLMIKIDKNVQFSPSEKKKVSVFLPNLKLISLITLFFLYGLLSFMLIAFVNMGFFSPGAALLLGIAFASFQFILSPFIMDFSLRWFYHLEWVALDSLPGHLQDFIKTACAKNNMKIPRLGVIHDGAPNAFTYGHTPNNARIVITSGIMDLLEPDEFKAVVAHEIGYAVHWDMLIMTAVYLVPLIFYYIYRTITRIRTGDRDKFAGFRYIIAIIPYILYIVSEYMVLWFSRIREYSADRFAGETMGNPNVFASALVKIGYGLAGRKKNGEERKSQLESIKGMGIFDPEFARALAISIYRLQSLGGEVDKDNLKRAMKWDLWNPWAVYYELNSTQPLIAKRLLALSRQSESLGKETYINFDERKPETYRGEFFYDLVIGCLPAITIIIYIGLFFMGGGNFFLKFGILLTGVTYLFKVIFSYDFSWFPEMNISSLLKKIKVSGVRPVPCALKGRIVERGIPGLIWSEDFILQDDTGIIFLDYRQPLAMWNFLFGLLRAKRYTGKNVEITGWYRRAPVPYVEIKTLEAAGEKRACFVFNVKITAAVIIIILGIALMLSF